MVATTELVQIDIPQEFIKLAGEWYSNQDDMLYAVSSAGEVTLGDRTPLNEETWLLMTPQEHHIYLWEKLAYNIRAAILNAWTDRPELEAFGMYVGCIIVMLHKEYDIEE